MEKLTYEYIKKYIEKEGYILLSKTYKNSASKLKLRCKNDHVFKISWSNFQQGNRCKKCFFIQRSKNVKYSKEYIKNMLEKCGYRLLSNEYINNRTFIKVQCDKKHVFNTTWSRFQQGSRCPECYKNSIKGSNSVFWKNYTIADLENYKNYKLCVSHLSNQNFSKFYYEINYKKLKRGKYKYHLDHIYSILDGFKNNIPPNVISNPNNLQMLWWSNNISKLDKSWVTKQELFLGYYKHEIEKGDL